MSLTKRWIDELYEAAQSGNVEAQEALTEAGLWTEDEMPSTFYTVDESLFDDDYFDYDSKTDKNVTPRTQATIKMSQPQLVLSLFCGIDILGKGFEREGFCVVRAGDLIFGQDIRGFHAPALAFDGIIAGSPCQDYSQGRRTEPTGYGDKMLVEFCRIVTEATPDWFLLENVTQVPDVQIEGYTVQRLNINAAECGLSQNRNRCFQFGSQRGLVIVPARSRIKYDRSQLQKTCMASEGNKKQRRSWSDFCELQGLPRDFQLKDFTKSARYKAVGNAVPLPMARTMAKAIRDATNANNAGQFTEIRLCPCQCGRILEGRKKSATAACRKRLSRVTVRQTVRAAKSQVVTELL